MKRSNVLRLAAILAVVVLASMTTGCLKASVSLKSCWIQLSTP